MNNQSGTTGNHDFSSYSCGYGGSHLSDFAAMDCSEDPELAALAQQILEDPVALEKLSDRVYELFQQEVRWQQERHQDYRRM